ELDFQTIGRQQFNHRSYIADGNIRIRRTACDCDEIEQLRFALRGHRYASLSQYIAAHEARHDFVLSDNPRRTKIGGSKRTRKLEVNQIALTVSVALPEHSVFSGRS